jgi:hypothetical protein
MSVWTQALGASLGDSLLFCGKLALFLVPFMVALEFLKDSVLLRPRDGAFSRLLRRFGFSPASSLALLAGLATGIIYGAGILMGLAREHRIPRHELAGVALFLCLCHAVVEDPLLFVLVGGEWHFMMLPRMGLALAAVWLLERRRRCAPAGAR